MRQQITTPASSSASAAHAYGLALVIAAATCWSIGALLVRLVEVAGAWEIVFWRCAFMVMFLGGVLLAREGQRLPAKFRAVGASGVLSGFFLSLSFVCFVLSVTLTKAANTLVIMSTAPLVSAAFGILFLRERVPAPTWLAMIAAAGGIALMFADSLEAGSVAGDLVAFGVPLAFSANVIILRWRSADTDMLPTVVIAGLFGMAFALPFALPFAASGRDIAVLAVMGSLQLGMGCMLMTLATRHLRAAQVGLSVLLETTLGVLWVWIGVGERPSDLGLLGGAVVIGALAASQAAGLGRSSRAPPVA